LDSFIHQSNSFLDKSVCEDLINQFETHTWLQTEGRIGMKYDNNSVDSLVVEKDIKQSTDLGITDTVANSPAFKPSIIKLFEFLNENVIEYKKKYDHLDLTAEWGMTEKFNIQRYYPGQGYYQWHSEYHPHIPPADKRILAWMIYLNDVKDAGTEFAYFGKTDAVQGKCVLWPAYWTHTHRGVVSDTQTKYIATGWYSFLNI